MAAPRAWPNTEPPGDGGRYSGMDRGGGLPARCHLAWPHSVRRASLSREGGPLGALLLVVQVRIPSRGDKPGSCPPAKPLIREVRESCLYTLSGAHLPLDAPLRPGHVKRPDQALPRRSVKPWLLLLLPSGCDGGVSCSSRHKVFPFPPCLSFSLSCSEPPASSPRPPQCC